MLICRLLKNKKN